MSVLDQSYVMTNVGDVSPHPDNPRQGNVDLIEDSIVSNGFYGALIAQRSTGHILAGNHRWLAAKTAGLAEVPVLWIDVDDDRARRILLGDNRTGDLATYDERGLLALLEELSATPESLTGTGYDLDALEDLQATFGEVTTLPPTTPTDASYAETDEQYTERAAQRGLAPSIHQTGLRELILVYEAAVHEQAVELIGTLRRALGADATSSDAVLAALRLAVQHADELAVE